MAPKKGDAARTVPVEPQPDEPTLENRVKRLEDSMKDATEKLDVVDVRLEELEIKDDKMQEEFQGLIDKTVERMDQQDSSLKDEVAELKKVVRELAQQDEAGFDNDPSAGSPMETLLRLLLPLNDKVQWTSRDVAGSEPPTSLRSEHFTGPFNRINQVAFLRDVRPACSSTHYLGRGEAITGQDHRSCRGTKCTSYERPGPRPYAHEIYRIQKHDRASMHRRGRIMPIDTLGTPSTTEVHHAATRSLDEKGMTIHPKFHRFRYATQDPYRTPWARRPQGEDIEEECGSTVRCMNHGACRHTQPFHHSHAHCVLVAASTPTGPQPTRAKDSIEERRKQ
ncbi:hypothetical protein V6N13_116827 [Hibiscus sabdariffa]